MSKISDLEPNEVFRFFDEICGIPRESGHCEKISRYLYDFAERKGLYAYADSFGNVLIRKPASKGYESYETIILQGHMDMVCEKKQGLDFDFAKDEIRAYIDGDFIRAKGTTLGGDNGIGLSMMLAVLNDDTLMHPEIEALFTVDEETDMGGAFGFDCGRLHGKRVINLDSEYEGIIMASCAGGIDAVSRLPMVYTKKSGTYFKLFVTGLKGGHSGVEIDKGRANANVLLGRLLFEISKRMNFGLCDYFGGDRETAIAAYGDCGIIIDERDKEAFLTVVKEYEKIFNDEYRHIEDDIRIIAEAFGQKEMPCLDDTSKSKLVTALVCLPDGVQEMCADMPGLVQTSVNLGKARLTEKAFEFTNSIRSCMDTKKYALGNRISETVKLLGGITELKDEYPGWTFNKDSKLTEIVVKSYKEVLGIDAKVDAVHAGMECGIFAKGIPDMDCVSIGPTMGDVHTPDEYLSISSSKHTYMVLRHIIESCRFEG